MDADGGSRWTWREVDGGGFELLALAEDGAAVAGLVYRREDAEALCKAANERATPEDAPATGIPGEPLLQQIERLAKRVIELDVWPRTPLPPGGMGACDTAIALVEELKTLREAAGYLARGVRDNRPDPEAQAAASAVLALERGVKPAQVYVPTVELHGTARAPAEVAAGIRGHSESRSPSPRPIAETFGPADMRRRLGRFRIAEQVIFEHPTAVQRAMAEVIIVRAELMWSSSAVEYQAMSRHFDPVPPAEEPPLYVLEFDRSALPDQPLLEDGPLRINFRRAR